MLRTAPFARDGKRDDGRGVLLLHGLTGTPHEVRPLGQRLAAAGMTVVAPLLPGHGTTPAALARTTRRDWEAAARDELGRLRARCSRVGLIGLSMGALLALGLATSEEPPPEALVMMATPLWLPLWERLALQALGLLGRPRAIPKLLGSDVADEEARLDNPSLRAMPVPALLSLLELMDLSRERLARVKAPTLVLHGRHDRTAPPACAEAIAAGIPRARLVWFEESQHLLPLDRERDAVASTVVRFLDEVIPRSRPCP